MKNSDYWRQRFMMLEEAAHAEGVEYTKTYEREFAKAQRSLQSDIEKWYARFAKNNEISYSEARRMLNADQLKEFRWTVQDYIKAGESLDPAWAKQLENASAKVHISRLEALQYQIQQQAEVLFGNQVDGMDGLLRKVYSNGYYHTAFEIQKGFNLGWDLQSLNPKQLDTMLSKPWTLDGKTFSDRIWTNKTDLINTLHTHLTQGIIRGDGPDKAIEAVADRFRVSKNRANALVMTESAYFSAVAQKDCFNSLDVEKFEVVSTLDGRTCETCGDFDGMVFPMSQYEPGVTANPFHTSCRCCTAPHFDDDYGERAARNVDGEVYYVPSNIKYEDWKKSLEGLQKSAQGGTLKKSITKADFQKLAASQNLTKTESKQIWSRDDGQLGYIQASKNYGNINGYLRGLTQEITPDNKATIKALDDVTERNLLPSAYTGYRKMDPDYLSNVLGVDIPNSSNMPGFDFTNEKSAVAAVDAIKNLANKEITDKAYTSISLIQEQNYFTMRPIEFVIDMPQGTKGLVTNNISESEFITARGSTIEIVDAEVYHPKGKYKDRSHIRIYARLKQ